MSKCMLVLEFTPKTCDGCPFLEKTYGDPLDCKLFSLVGINVNQFTTDEPIEKHVKNKTKCPYCPLKPIPDLFPKK